MIATAEEQLSEKKWAANRDNSRAGPLLAAGRGLADLAFEGTLTHWEHENLLQYRKLASGVVCMLGQNAQKRPHMSDPCYLMAIIKNVHIAWSDEHGRWLTPAELLVAQGFPADPSLYTAKPTTSFQRVRDAPRKLCSDGYRDTG